MDFSGTPVRLLAESSSTNTDALNAFDHGEGGPFWMVAERQTAGRGRQGREWTHIPGNFAGTLLRPVHADNIRHPAAISFLAGLSVMDALAAIGPIDASRLALKWPNDVWLDRRKISGILIELAGPDRMGRRAVAIGIGVNLAGAPSGSVHTTCLSEATGRRAPPVADFGHALGAAFSAWWDRFERLGPFNIYEAFTQRAAGLGEVARVITGETSIEGVFTGVDPSGALRLICDGQELTFLAADVQFRPAV